jgi:DNA-binding LacI/PurR family transcriptional regulator
LIAINDLELTRGRGKCLQIYQQISQHLQKKIESGHLKNGQHLPPVSQLVKLYKVDYQTVNSAIDELDRKKLIKIMEGRGRGPLIIAGFAQKTYATTIAFLRWEHDPLAMNLTNGIDRFTTENSCKCYVFDASRSHEDMKNLLKTPPPDIKGLILFPIECQDYTKIVKSLIKTGMKIVFVDRYLENINVSSVSMDHVRGAYLATKHLLEKHASPVHYFGLTNKPSSCKDRFEGWKLAMCEYGYENQTDYIWDIGTGRNNILDSALTDDELLTIFYQESLKLLKSNSNNKKVSILCVADILARGFYPAADETGRQIGKDLFLVGFGDTPICQKLPVPLTSVNQANEQVGYEAAKILKMDLCGQLQHPVKQLLPCQIVIRDSSGSRA